jgi:glutamyl-tRNA synthetase
LAELVDAFSLERAQKAGASFDIEKLQWINKQHLKLLDVSDLAQRMKPAVIAAGYPMPSEDALAVIVGLMRERVTFLEEIPTQADYLFRDPTVYDESVVKKQWKGDAAAKVVALKEQFAALSEWTRDDIDQAMTQAAEGMGLKKGAFMAVTRLAVSGAAGGPDLLDMMVLLGKETCLRRFVNVLSIESASHTPSP